MGPTKKSFEAVKSLPRQGVSSVPVNDRWFSHMERQSVAVLCCPESLNSMIVKILKSSDSNVDCWRNCCSKLFTCARSLVLLALRVLMRLYQKNTMSVFLKHR